MLGKIVFVATVAALANVANAADACGTSDALAISRVGTAEAALCKTATAFTFIRTGGYPNDTQLTAMCANADCVKYMGLMNEQWTKDCDLSFGAAFPVINPKAVANAFADNCKRLDTGAGPAPTTTAPAPTTTAPAPTTTAPAPTTTAPAPTTKAPEPTTQAPEPTTKAPEPTTQAPEPTPTVTTTPPLPHC